MKKQYFMMAIAATMFAACSQTEVIDEVVDNSTPKAIEFTTYAQGQTRAENYDQGYTWNLEDHHTTFKVWAYKNVADAKVFDGDVVTHTKTSSDPLTYEWKYTNTRYWDKAASWYEFYAAAPENFSWVLNENTTDKADDYFTLANYELKGDNLNKGGFSGYNNSFKTLPYDKDLMIADEKNVVNASFYGNVHLEFIHILSRLNITVKKDSRVTDNVNLVKLDVVDLKNIGNFNENAITATLADGITSRWTAADNYTTITYDKNEIVETTAKHAIQALVIPQVAGVTTVKLDGSNITDVKKPYIRIEYTITPAGGNAETFVAYYNLATAFTNSAPTDIAFNEGWQNTLNITIAPTAITFDANVAPWGENNKDLPIE